MNIRGRPFDSEGGGGWQIWSGQIIYFQRELGRKIDFQEYQGQHIYFHPQQNFEKFLKINNLSCSGKKINNLPFTFVEFREKFKFCKNFGLASLGTVNYKFLNIFPLALLALNSQKHCFSYRTLNTYTYNVSMYIYISLYTVHPFSNM